MELKSVMWVMVFVFLSVIITTLLFSMANYIRNKPLGDNFTNHCLICQMNHKNRPFQVNKYFLRSEKGGFEMNTLSSVTRHLENFQLFGFFLWYLMIFFSNFASFTR
jgi:hypothetical protein